MERLVKSTLACPLCLKTYSRREHLQRHLSLRMLESQSLVSLRIVYRTNQVHYRWRWPAVRLRSLSKALYPSVRIRLAIR